VLNRAFQRNVSGVVATLPQTIKIFHRDEEKHFRTFNQFAPLEYEDTAAINLSADSFKETLYINFDLSVYASAIHANKPSEKNTVSK